MTLTILSVMLSSCEADITESFINTDPVISAQTTTSGTVPNMLRIKVDESKAEKFLDSCTGDGYVDESVLEAEGFAVDGLRVRPTFMIGGKYLERQKQAGLDRWFDVISDSSAVETKSVTGLPGVEYAEPVYIPVRTDKFQDPKSSAQWHFLNEGNNNFVAGVDIGLNEAWEIYGKYGKDNVIVAVVDAGVDYEHEDLKDNIWVNHAEAEGVEGVDDDGNGYVDDIHGFNFDGLRPEMTPDDHGTHVAGVIAAVNGNGIGVHSIAGGRYPEKGVQIMCLQSISDGGGSSDYAKILQYAAENGAVISQNSWIYVGANHTPQVDKVAIDYFTEFAGTDEHGNQVGPMKGGLVIFAAGNEAAEVGHPAMYETCLSVAAIGPRGKYAYYTNYGDWVDVCAPGGDQAVDAIRGGVFSTLVGNRYGGLQGTSMACPHVSGLAALIVSEFGKEGFTSADLRRIIEESCDPSVYIANPSMEGKLGKGMIDVVRAIASFSEVAPDAVEEHSCQIKSNYIELNVRVPEDSDDARAYMLKVDLQKSGADPLSYEFMMEDYEIDTLGCVHLTINGLEFECKYSYSISARDYAGNESPASAPVEFTTGANNKPLLTIDSNELIEVNRTAVVTRKIRCEEPDGHDYEVSVASDTPEGAVYVVKNTDVDYTLFVDGSLIPDGDYTFTFTATDVYGASESVSGNISAGNAVPELIKQIPDVYINGLEQNVELKFTDYFFDEDGEELTASFELSSDVVKVVKKNDKIIITPQSAGTSKVAVVVSDNAGETVQTSFNVVVRDASKPFDIYPVQAHDVINIRTGEAKQYIVTIFGSTGREVLRQVETIAMDKVLTIDVSSLSPGYYTVKLKSEDGSEYKSAFVKL